MKTASIVDIAILTCHENSFKNTFISSILIGLEKCSYIYNVLYSWLTLEINITINTSKLRELMQERAFLLGVFNANYIQHSLSETRFGY